MTALKRPGYATRLAMLSALYFVEGMPWGFQAKALPMFMRTHHASLTLIGLTSLLSVPWMTKILWAPLVDRYSSPRLGKRKTWIVPMQICIAITAFAGALVADGASLVPLLLLVALMNLFSATMDIAVDGLAVALLAENELGTGDVAQVVGYKFGTLIAGGLLAAAFGDEHWPWLFASMGGLALLACVATLVFVEPPEEPEPAPAPVAAAEAPDPAVRLGPRPPSLRRIVGLLGATLKGPGMVPLLAVLATYKTGEQLIDSMFKPFLIDCGFTVAQVALWVSSAGMGASMAGSFLGGILASRIRVLRALSIAAVFRAVPVFFVFLISLHPPTRNEVIVVALAENFFGGLLTTTVFAYMMSRTDKRIGATHFTLLSTIEMLGKAPIPLIAGPVAQIWGYSVLFGVGTVFSAAFLLLLPALGRADASRLRESPAASPPGARACDDGRVRRTAPLLLTSVVALAGCGDAPPPPAAPPPLVVAADPTPGRPTAPSPPGTTLAARPSPPTPVAEFAQVDAAAPPAKMPRLEILSPAKNQVVAADKAAALAPKLRVKDWPLGEAGAHLCVMLDRGPCKKVKSLDELPPLGALGPLGEGSHVLVAFARRGSNESVKPTGKSSAFAATPFFVGKRGPPVWKEGSPMLILSVDERAPAPGEGVLLDCYVANAEIAEGRFVIHASVAGPGLGDGAGLRGTTLAPFRLKNAQPGEHLVRFSLHAYGATLGPSATATTVSFKANPVEGPFAEMTRTFFVTAP